MIVGIILIIILKIMKSKNKQILESYKENGSNFKKGAALIGLVISVCFNAILLGIGFIGVRPNTQDLVVAGSLFAIITVIYIFIIMGFIELINAKKIQNNKNVPYD